MTAAPAEPKPCLIVFVGHRLAFSLPDLRVLTEREEKNGVAIASNGGFSKAHVFRRAPCQAAAEQHGLNGRASRRSGRILRRVTVIYVLDGTQVRTLEDFWHVVGESVGCGGYFGRNLDAFADGLRGGFGTPDDGDYGDFAYYMASLPLPGPSAIRWTKSERNVRSAWRTLVQVRQEHLRTEN